MVLAYHGIYRSQTQLAQELNTSMVTGTEYADMARVLNTYLFDCEVPQAGQPGYRVEYLTPGSRGAYWSTFIGNCEVYSCVLENERFTVPGPLKMG